MDKGERELPPIRAGPEEKAFGFLKEDGIKKIANMEIIQREREREERERRVVDRYQSRAAKYALDKAHKQKNAVEESPARLPLIHVETRKRRGTSAHVEEWLRLIEEKEKRLVERLRRQVLDKSLFVEQFQSDMNNAIGFAPLQNKQRLVNIRERAASTVEQWVEPEPWNPGWRRNVICERCLSSESWTLVNCTYCNCVAHLDCLRGREKELGLDGKWICDPCLEELELSRNQYCNRRAVEYEREFMRACAIRIASQWRSCIMLRRFRKKRAAVRLLQARWRRQRLVRSMMEQRRTQARPIIIRIIKAQDLPTADWDNNLADPYVAITVLKENGDQLYRLNSAVKYETLSPTWDETFVIPGITGDSLLVLTLLDEDDKRDQVVGQVLINLMQENLWKSGGVFTTKLREVKVPIRDHTGSIERVDYDSLPCQGSITFELKPLINLRSVCGYLLAPNLDLLVQDPFVAQKRRRKCWGMLLEGKLYLYKYYQDTEPKRVIDMKGVNLKWEVEPEGISMVVPLSLSLSIKLTIPDHADVDRWRTGVEVTRNYGRRRMSDLLQDVSTLTLKHQEMLSAWRKKATVSKPSKGGRRLRKLSFVAFPDITLHS